MSFIGYFWVGFFMPTLSPSKSLYPAVVISICLAGGSRIIGLIRFTREIKLLYYYKYLLTHKDINTYINGVK